MRPGDLGVDAMHINLHKTFSTPHGGGGPGAGPVVLSAALAPFAPPPWVVHGAGRLRPDRAQRAARRRRRSAGSAPSTARWACIVRALAYMMSHGADGLRQVAEDAVLNANYVKARLAGVLSPAFPDGPCMHEALFDDAWLEGTGVTTLDFAKALIDEGFHPMTMYFPLVVHGAMLIEPTETEPKAEIDRFCDALLALAAAAKAGDAARFRRRPPRPAPPPGRDRRRPQAAAALAPGPGAAPSRGVEQQMSADRIHLSVAEAREHSASGAARHRL